MRAEHGGEGSVIPGGAVERYGLRACPLGCAGRCQRATAKADGTIVSSPACVLMTGPPPVPGEMPPLTHHTIEQLQVMAALSQGADPDVRRAAVEELALRERGKAGAP